MPETSEYGCGCKAHVAHIEHCPLHAAARGMLEALEAFVNKHRNPATPSDADLMDKARAAIGAAKGDQ